MQKVLSRTRDISNFPTQGWADTTFYMRNWSETYQNCIYAILKIFKLTPIYALLIYQIQLIYLIPVLFGENFIEWIITISRITSYLSAIIAHIPSIRKVTEVVYSASNACTRLNICKIVMDVTWQKLTSK